MSRQTVVHIGPVSLHLDSDPPGLQRVFTHMASELKAIPSGVKQESRDWQVRLRLGKPAFYSGEAMTRVYDGPWPDGVPGRIWFSQTHRRVEVLDRITTEIDLVDRKIDVIVAAGHESSVGYYCFTLIMGAALAEVGHFPVHAATLVYDGPEHPEAMLLVGTSGSGKSTTTLALAHDGFALAGEDVSYLLPTRSPQVWSLPSDSKIAPATIELLPWLGNAEMAPANTPDELTVTRTSLDRLIRFAPVQTYPLRRVIFLKPRNPIGHQLTPISPILTISGLSYENVWRCPEAPAAGASAFAAFTKIACSVKAYNLSIGPDLAELPQAILAAFEKEIE